ncbi:hypothetical protein KP001_11985 [Geomonas subterranea]|uniref:DUF5666 domain-containing protein n=1 Tax=Geomonas subterranea TaxID=2847989 RepID=A0ABX8LER0_9BACT|nr:hypothetical protein [Geomonas subterranea]QXE89187.1 hypothetical protein KP001_11985 [Geomonas subterranea]QXM08698.1 hypothetical protein KP002_17290 [Geomonas subterranea]
MNKALIVPAVLLLSLASTSAYAASKKVTMTGMLSPNANGTATFFKTNDGKEYTFDPLSKVGKKIWKVCELEVPCTITGTVDNYGIASVTVVKKGK